MKQVLCLIVLCGFILTAHAGWESIGPYGGYMRSIVCSYTNDNYAYAATYTSPSKIVKTTDGGNSWSVVGQVTYTNYCMAIDPTNHNNVYFGTYYRVYRSTNGGSSWISSNYFPSIYVYDLTVHPTNSSIIFGAGRNYVATSTYSMEFIKSTDGGANFTSTTVTSGGYSYGYAIAVDPSNPNTMYIGGCGYGSSYEPRVYKSTDGGATWFLAYSNTTGYYVYSIAVHPTNSNIVVFGTYTGGIYRSTDGGSSWTKVSTNYYNYRMRTSQADPEVIYSSAYNTVYRSTNSGQTWTTTSSGLSGYSFYGLAVSQANASKVMTCSNSGCFRTTNSGSNWVDCNEGMCFADIIGIGIAPSQPSTMYVTNEDVAVFKTTNNGTDWTKCPSFTSCGDMAAYSVHNTDPNIVIALEGVG
jgi:photosystem II stability/assembly factor-like uncharacterized protein